MWLLAEDTFRALQRAEASGLIPTAEQQAEFQARVEVEAATPRNMSVAGGVAEIKVEGTLTKKPDLFALWFGGGNTTYRDIQQALGMAASDPTIKRVQMSIDSPGGNVDGLFETLAAIENFKASGKPISVRASSAQSAAYAIAAVSGKIEATGPAAMFGSIGVAASFLLRDDVVTLTNTDSPAKRPDLKTEEGRAVVIEHLNAINKLFVGSIAAGRGVDADDVTQNFGRGATLLATDAKKKEMIDSIAKPVLRNVNKTAAEAEPAEQLEKTAMTVETLKAQHPELVKALIQEERDRVDAHLTAGEQSGDMKTAVEAIRSGAPMTQLLLTKYMMATANRADRGARQAETDAVATVVDNAAPAKTEADLGEQVVAEVERLLGITSPKVA